jgi:hypothetical protein
MDKKETDDVKSINLHLHHDLLYRGGGVDAQLGHVAVLGEEDGKIVIA